MKGKRLWELPIPKGDSLIGKQWVVFHVVEIQRQSWLTMSAPGGKADIAWRRLKCLLMTQSGH
jgi:hypothetical protein